MKPLQNLSEKAARSLKTIALSEGSDPRIVSAAVEARRAGIAKIILVGNAADVRHQLQAVGGENLDGIEVFDPASNARASELASAFYELRKHKGMTQEGAQEAVLQTHVCAALLVKTGHADGTLGGAVATTADIVRAAIQVIGTAPGSKMVSSFFLMLLCEEHHKKKGAVVFSDAGLVVDPNAEEMAEIARASAASYASLIDEVPRVAMLSFSTRASAKHASVTKVSRATELAKEADPDLIIDGEMQFDAAFVSEVAETKASDSPLKGNANVFIFPNLDAGNIAYKIAQRVGGATAVGPILQGLAKPANDLSRGCSADDVLHMIAVTACQCSLTTES